MNIIIIIIIKEFVGASLRALLNMSEKAPISNHNRHVQVRITKRLQVHLAF